MKKISRPSAEAGYAEHLSARGDNLAQVTQYLYEHDRDRFDRILEVMRARVPGVISCPGCDARWVPGACRRGTTDGDGVASHAGPYSPPSGYSPDSGASRMRSRVRSL